jgi:hypothetical protein
MILSEHETAQLVPEVTIDARRQGGLHRRAVRGPPAFSAKVDHVRSDHQILNQEAGIALETRAGRRIGLEPPLLINDHLRARAAPPLPLAGRLRRFRLARLFHPARLDVLLDLRPARPALQPSDLVTQRRNQPPKFRCLLQQPQRQALDLGRRKRVDVQRRRHSPIESEIRRFGNPRQPPRVNLSHLSPRPLPPPRQRFCPSYRSSTKKLAPASSHARRGLPLQSPHNRSAQPLPRHSSPLARLAPDATLGGAGIQGRATRLAFKQHTWCV